jgi:hypothetical protein
MLVLNWLFEKSNREAEADASLRERLDPALVPPI